jgi:hypothetical protein
MARPPRSELAWAAGLIEGDGSIVLAPEGPRLQVRLTDQDVLEHLRNVLGGSVYGPYRQKELRTVGWDYPRKQFWIWALTGPRVERACQLIEPWLGQRRRARLEQLSLLSQRRFDLDEVRDDELVIGASGRPSKTDVAWASGLFEAEGSTVISHWGTVRLQVKMTDEDVLIHLRSVLGGVVNGPYQYEHPDGRPRKPFWTWQLAGQPIGRVSRWMEPWLGKRRSERMEQVGLFAQGQLFTDDPDDEEID